MPQHSSRGLEAGALALSGRVRPPAPVPRAERGRPAQQGGRRDALEQQKTIRAEREPLAPRRPDRLRVLRAMHPRERRPRFLQVTYAYIGTHCELTRRLSTNAL